MLRVGIGEYFYTRPYGFEAGVARMKSHGYDTMDYQELVTTEKELYEVDFASFEKYLRNQAEICRREGIEIFQIHGPWRYPPQDGLLEQRNERFEKMSKAIEGAAILGSKHMVIHPLMPFTIKDEGHYEEVYGINLDFFSRLCHVGREYDVVICMENMPMHKFSMSSSEEIMKLVKEVNDDYFQMCLDTGHSSAIKNSPAAEARFIGKEHLYTLHVNDNKGHFDDHLNPFLGVIDWDDLASALHEIDYHGAFNLEVKRPVIPSELAEDYEKLVYRKAAYLAKKASGEK